jgi:hypothetical protein
MTEEVEACSYDVLRNNGLLLRVLLILIFIPDHSKYSTSCGSPTDCFHVCILTDFKQAILCDPVANSPANHRVLIISKNRDNEKIIGRRLPMNSSLSRCGRSGKWFVPVNLSMKSRESKPRLRLSCYIFFLRLSSKCLPRHPLLSASPIYSPYEPSYISIISGLA